MTKCIVLSNLVLFVYYFARKRVWRRILVLVEVAKWRWVILRFNLVYMNLRSPLSLINFPNMSCSSKLSKMTMMHTRIQIVEVSKKYQTTVLVRSLVRVCISPDWNPMFKLCHNNLPLTLINFYAIQILNKLARLHFILILTQTIYHTITIFSCILFNVIAAHH